MNVFQIGDTISVNFRKTFCQEFVTTFDKKNWQNSK